MVDDSAAMHADSPTSSNYLDLAVWAITYVVNGIDIFIKDGTMDGFLSTETLTDTLSNRVRGIRQDFKLYCTGDLEFIKGFKQYAFLSSVEKLRKDLVAIRKSKRGIDLKQVDDWLKEVDSMQVECKRIEAQTGSRVQPYHFLLVSGSGISKSHLLKLFSYTIAKSNNIPCDEEYVYYLNQANKFQSGWSNYKTIVMVDDSAAMHADSPTSSNYLDLADWVLRSDNNVPHELLAADVKEKGALFNRSVIQGWASNSFTQDFEKRARFASAINRRIQVRIVGQVRPEYVKSNRDGVSKSTRIDYSKLPKDQSQTICPDAWLFTCYECEIEDTGVNVKKDFNQPIVERDAKHCYVVCYDMHGKQMLTRNLEDTLKFLQWHSKLHFENQERVIEVGDKVYDPANYCDHGLPIGLNCDKCAELKAQFPILDLDPILEESSCLTSTDSVSSTVEDIVVEDASDEYEPVSQNDSACTIHLDVAKLLGTDNVSRAKSKVSNVSDSTSVLRAKANIPSYHDVVRERRMVFEEIWTRNENRVDSESMPAFMKLRTRRQDILHHQPCYTTFDTIKHILMCQSGCERRIKYCKVLLDKLNEMRILGISNRLLSAKSLLEEMRNVAASVKGVLSDWFSGLVCDVISYLCDKLFDYVERFILNPLQFIPVSLEDTMLSQYMYSKHPMLRFTMFCDYVNYLGNYYLFNYGVHPSKHIISCDITRNYYDKYIRTKTPVEISEMSRYEPMSLNSFARKVTSKISK